MGTGGTRGTREHGEHEEHGEHGEHGEEVEERRVVYRESASLVFREVDMEERKRKRRSEDRSSFFGERQREKSSHRLY